MLSKWLVLLGGKLKTKQTRNNTSLYVLGRAPRNWGETTGWKGRESGMKLSQTVCTLQNRPVVQEHNGPLCWGVGHSRGVGQEIQ